MTRDDLTDVPGFRVGSAEDLEACTGCTVVLCPEGGAVGGVDQRGGAPGTRETDLLRPLHLVERCHAVVLSGGSAFGLDSATGVVRYLESRRVGLPTPAALVPIVPCAVLYDLGIGRPHVRPDAAMGLAACYEAEKGGPVRLGNAGAGAGATVGKALGPAAAMKGGLGSASTSAVGAVVVGALVAANAFGDVVDPTTGEIVAGTRSPGSREFADTVEILRARASGASRPPSFSPESTVLAVVATNARLDKEGANVLAQMASAGLARVLRPAHTRVDGDTLFALAAGDHACDVNLLGALAADAVARATLRAVREARPLGGVPAAGSD
ncbi:MAG: P1 family peptidase [Deltaproteobacteria bacterium]|nr:P1 family peptidase [Deltaproteobacteria bacterium]